MKNLIFIILSIPFTNSLFGQDINPFESIGKDGKVITLSNGKYTEVHINDSLQRIGSAIVNMNTGKIFQLIEFDTLYDEATLDPTVISRWYSTDPLNRMYPELSPYNFTGNNPIMFVDSDGAVIVDPATNKPVEKVDGQWRTVDFDVEGNKTYGAVSERFTAQTKPVLDVLNKSEMGRENIAYLQEVPTLVTIDPSYPDPKPGDNSSVHPTSNKYTKKDGVKYYEQVVIIPDYTVIEQNAGAFDLDVDEKLSGVMDVEVAHLEPDQIQIDQGNGSFEKKYNKLLNNHIRAQISYRNENGIELDDSLFAPTDKLETYGFKLDTENQKLRDELKE